MKATLLLLVSLFLLGGALYELPLFLSTAQCLAIDGKLAGLGGFLGGCLWGGRINLGSAFYVCDCE